MFLNVKKENEMSLFVYSKKTVFYMFQKIDALPVTKKADRNLRTRTAFVLQENKPETFCFVR